MIIVATIPTGIIGVLFNKTFESFYSNLIVIGAGLIVTGTILWIAERFGRSEKRIMDMKFRDALIVGLMQGAAITPGLSRSGSCLFGGLMTNLDRELAVRFAFLISVPSILGSFIFEMKDAAGTAIPAGTLGPIIAGMIVAFAAGLFAIKAMIKIVTQKSLKGFSFYTWILGAAVVVYAIFVA
jgi:undecaprenyl-diphosphatase